MSTNVINKVVAIIPPSGGSSFTGQSIPPMGVVRILNYVKKFFPYIEVELWDGVQLNMPMILKKFKTLSKDTLVAISAHTSYNYRNCLTLLRTVPDDVKVIMGGLHLNETHLGQLAVERRNFHTIQGPGEFALPQYIEYLEGKRDVSEVKNLMYLQNGIFIKNDVEYHSQEDFTFPEYEGIIDLKEYGEQYRVIFGESDLGLVVMSPEGCLWKKRSRGCLFCDIGSVYRNHSPFFLPRWIAHQVERYGNNKRITFWDYADEVSGAGFEWWNEVEKNMKKLGLRPKDKFALKVYVKSGRGFFDNNEIASALSRCGTEVIHLGVEGGDNQTLASWRKGCTIEDHLKSASLAGRHGMNMIISFAIGAPGTTKQSLSNIRDLIGRMKEKARIIAIAALTVAPLPGSLMWEMIKQRVKEKYSKIYNDLFLTDDPDLEEIRRIWVKEMCPNLVRECGSLPETMEWLRNEAEDICKSSTSKIVTRIE
jgi:anaerobic magnesium-protoporphyrin IX monomethyl ester cyclase